MKHEVGALGDYRGVILALAGESVLANEIPRNWRELHIPASHLYEIIRIARNDALHQGAFARHLTAHAIQLEIVLEDALMSQATTVGDFMVRNPICAGMWQPISFVRQQMLASSFSYLPVLTNDRKWYVVSDLSIVTYLRADLTERNKRFAHPLEQAVNSGELVLEKAKCHQAGTLIKDILSDLNNVPILVCRRDDLTELVGILTVFDLL